MEKGKKGLFEGIIKFIKLLLKGIAASFIAPKKPLQRKEKTQREEGISEKKIEKVRPLEEKITEAKVVKEVTVQKQEEKIVQEVVTERIQGVLEEQAIETVEQVKKQEEEKPSTKKDKIEKPSEEPESIAELAYERATRKPYVIKPPTEEVIKPEKPQITREKTDIPKREEIITLGKRQKRKYKGRKQKEEIVEIIEKGEEVVKKLKETAIRIIPPFIEIDLDELNVSFVLPEQRFRINNKEGKILDNLNFKLEINGEGLKDIQVKVKSFNDEIAQTKEKKILLDKPIKSFEIKFPEEFESKTYKYIQKKEFIYVFYAIGNDRGRMHYLYDEDSKINPLPKKNIWILLKEDFDLKSQEIIVEENKWVWSVYRPFLVNLRKASNLIVENRKDGIQEALACIQSFTIEGEQLVEDDFSNESPLFVGKTLKIKSPEINPSGWSIWIQSRESGYKIATENWNGQDLLELKLPECLPCEYGEFQIDICNINSSVAEETLFFRWIDFMELDCPKNLLIPDPAQGSKEEKIMIKLGIDEGWCLSCKEDHKAQLAEKNVYEINVPAERDIIHLIISNKNRPENELKVQITIPRLKWKTFHSDFWRDKPLEIDRKDLKYEDNLLIKTNDLKNRYDLIAVLETNGRQLQEARFIRKGIEYFLDLKQFSDTFKNKEELNFNVTVYKDYQKLGTVDIFNIKKEIPIRKEKVEQKISLIKMTRRQWHKLMQRKLHRRMIKKYSSTKGAKESRNIRLLEDKCSKSIVYVKCQEGLRRGKGFSIQEIMQAEINPDDLRSLYIPCDKRRKSSHEINVEALKKVKRGK